MTFYNGTTSIGTGTVNAAGVATLNLTTLPTGTDSITANYGATAYFAASTSNAATVMVTAAVAASYTIAASPTSLTIVAGQTGTTTLTSTPVGGNAGTGGIAGLVAIGRKRKLSPKWPRWLQLGLLLVAVGVLAAGMAGCGGGNSQTTPAGTSNVIITVTPASGSSQNLSLNVTITH